MQDVTFTWKGIDYTVPENKLIGLIKAIENEVTLGELNDFQDFKKAKFGVVSSAYHAALRYAGCPATENEVHEGMFSVAGDDDKRLLCGVAIYQLMAIIQGMIPPDHLQEKGDGKKKAEGAEACEGSLSKKRTKRQSVGD